jgi:hypothetical protein
MLASVRRRIFRPARNVVEREYLKLAGRLYYHIKYIRLSYAAIGIVTAFITSSAVEKIEKQLPPEYATTVHSMVGFLHYLAIAIGILFVVQFLYALGAILFGKDEPPPPPPPDTEIRFTARSSTLHPELSKLTDVAVEQFEGDTMRHAVVQAAFRNGCALGLRIKDQHGKDVGFLDFYHVKRDVLDQWVAGTKYEKEIEETDFEPIAAAAARGDKHLRLFIGALLLKSQNRIYDYYLAPLVVTATKQHMRQQLAGFDMITIYASLFSKAGIRYAELEGMRVFRRKEDRGLAGADHDIVISSFRPHEAETRYVALSPHNVYVLEIRSE